MDDRPPASPSCLCCLVPARCRKGRVVPDRLKRLVEMCWAADYQQRPEFTYVVSELAAAVAELPVDPVWGAKKNGGGGGAAAGGGDGCCSVQ